MPATSNIRLPRTARPVPLTVAGIAACYGFLTGRGFTGKGYTLGIIELGGTYSPTDLTTFMKDAGLPVPNVTVINQGAQPDSDADGEVMLDIEVAAAAAPGAAFRMYMAANTDAAFINAVFTAIGDGCDVISISWGGPESSWAAGSVKAFSTVLAEALAKRIGVYVASGDSGADDGTGKPTCDYPASDPSVIGCGGTRLELTTAGLRALEQAWNDNPTQSATGGGASRLFPGRDVPDIAGNADPDTGYEIVLHGQKQVIGGTSAVAPLMAGLHLLLCEALGGRPIDVMKAIGANPSVCFDVTAGDNGAYRAGPGRDETTGFGVPAGDRLLAALSAGVTAPQPTPTPAPPVTGDPAVQRTWTARTDAAAQKVQKFQTSPHIYHVDTQAADALKNEGDWS
ncbi:S8 family serine peptidase [uncultured Jatrophihabitans sp.]|uniref:S53 family peptidase n=1 Tax=uncultured Jatrophihabitans sp. TaxID=1610747 RepID=UPI0035CB722D